MSVDLRVADNQPLVKAALLKEAARFQRRISQRTQSTVDRVYRPVLVGLAPSFMPSGYAPLIQRDVKIRTHVRGSRVTATVSAPTGGSTGRDMKARERGSLRHPVFAKGTRRHSFVRDGVEVIRGWRWVGQRIKPGFATTGLKAVRPQILRELDLELHDIARDVKRSA